MSYQEIIINLLKKYDEKDINADWLTLEIIDYLIDLRLDTIERQEIEKGENKNG